MAVPLGFTVSVHGLADAVSVYYDWVRQTV